ncbi:MAG: sodium-dependent bicarbonate transport family permease [Pseudomonadota bacterium]
MEFLGIAETNLLSPMVLSFVLGLIAVFIRSELSIPEAAAKAMSIYLLFAIGFKGGVEVARQGLSGEILAAIAIGIGLSLVLPLIAYALARAMTSLSPIDAAAVGAHYGSISIVTFVAATQALDNAGILYDGYMVAVAAAMEAPAIVAALWLVSRQRTASSLAVAGGPVGHAAPARAPMIPAEVITNGSIVLLCGAFAIGILAGERGRSEISSFIDAPFKGVLCLFLLDMGLLAGRHLRQSAGLLRPPVLALGLLMPLIGAAVTVPLTMMLGVSVGTAALFLTLAASASYIAVPSALRIALPEANPALYLTLSLGVTFPFNLALGIPLYITVASALGAS